MDVPAMAIARANEFKDTATETEIELLCQNSKETNEVLGHECLPCYRDNLSPCVRLLTHTYTALRTQYMDGVLLISSHLWVCDGFSFT